MGTIILNHGLVYTRPFWHTDLKLPWQVKTTACFITQPQSFRMLIKMFNEISHHSKINKLVCNSEISHLPKNNQNHINNEILCIDFSSLSSMLLPRHILFVHRHLITCGSSPGLSPKLSLTFYILQISYSTPFHTKELKLT